jgi:hypothetical protein
MYTYAIIQTMTKQFRGGIHKQSHSCGGGINTCYKFQYAFDDNLSVTHVFNKHIFKAVEVAPPSPSPHRAVQGVG